MCIRDRLSTEQADETNLAERGLALRQVLSLMIAQRRPSYYLARGRAELAALVDSHLRLLADGGVLDGKLRDVALAQQVTYRDWQTDPNLQRIDSDKGVSMARARLAGLLNLSYYELDRLDLEARASLNSDLQQQVSLYLEQLADPAFAESVGLFGDRLLSPSKTGEVSYSFTLFERTANGNQVRVQTDNTHQPFDINESSKLELGSTAKLRVMATYLEVIAELHGRLAAMSPTQLRGQDVADQDLLSRWAVDYLLSNPGADLTSMLLSLIHI